MSSTAGRRASDQIADRRFASAALAPRPGRGPGSGEIPAQIADAPYRPRTASARAEAAVVQAGLEREAGKAVADKLIREGTCPGPAGVCTSRDHATVHLEAGRELLMALGLMRDPRGSGVFPGFQRPKKAAQ